MKNLYLSKIFLALFFLSSLSIYSQNQRDIYVNCINPCVELSANTMEIGNSNTYRVESIDYQDLSNLVGSPIQSIDDWWSPKIDLDFSFCFFGQPYQKALINPNGVLTFSIAWEVENGQYSSNSYSFWNIEGSVPGTGEPGIGDARAVLSIFGVLQDMNPDTSFPGWSISYSSYGQSPFRKMVFNLKDLGPYMCGQSVGPQTSQIVLYETTNIVEVYVTSRTPCMSWQAGRGVIGIQNADASIGYTPPGRNTGSWSAQNEAWRFIPDGTGLEPEFVWKDEDGNIIGTDETINVCVDETTTFISQVSYSTCTGSTVTIEEEIVVLVGPPMIAEPMDLSETDDNEDGFAIFDLSMNDAVVLDGLDPSGYQVSYFETESDAQSGSNPIVDPTSYQNIQNPQTIYLRLEKLNTTCFGIASFIISVDALSLNGLEFEDMTLFPNPTSESLSIQSSQLVSETSVLIYDLLGKTLVSKNITPQNGAINVNVSSFVDGVYFVRISSEGKVAVRKLIKVGR